MSGGSDTKNVYLVGFMAAGKTTIGEALAELLGRTFVDLDQEIEQREGLTIPALFREKGEAYFRSVEADLLREFSSRQGLVVALGGGAFGNPENQDSLKESGVVIWIDLPFESLAERLLTAPNRPLNSSRQELEALYRRRLSDYKAAHIRIALRNQNPSEAASLAREAILNLRAGDSRTTKRPAADRES
ncbi:MAG: shikimate kinase [Acidobacteria bacterium]|nr:shikimate kinase [Acidobacteriota bacterium]